MKFNLALLAAVVTAQSVDTYETTSTSTSSSYVTGDDVGHEFMEDGTTRVIAEENYVTTTVTR